MRRLPKRTKGKAKRWPKGQSSNSNPETKKFREAARSRFFHHETPKKSTLTVGALKTLDVINSGSLNVQNERKCSDFDDATTFDSWATGKTFKTFASDWSECSNMSFRRILKKFEPTSALHKEMLAVLAAVTEVIKGNDGKETSTEYFGTLMTALTATESEDSTTATLSLLSMCIKTVPNEVLRLKFSESSKVLLEILAKYCETENGVILRSVIGCLSVIIRAQDPAIWAHSSTLEIFHSILVFVTHTKPRIRKSAQHAVCAILKASTMFSQKETHPAATSAAKYCIQQIEKGESLGGNTTTLHILGLLKDIVGVFPKNYIKSACETVLKLMTLGTPLTVNCCFEVLHGLFTSQPPSHNLTASLNAQILNALYDYQPSNNDVQGTLAWMTVMQEAYKSLARRDPQLCLENLTKFFSVSSRLWLNDKIELVKGSVGALRTVGMDCLPDCKECRNYNEIVRNIFGIVENGLKYQYHTAWPHIFYLLEIFFEVIGKTGETFMINCLKSLASLRDSHHFLHVTELDHTIGKAIRSLGPEIVIKAIPINITGNETDYDFKTSWILPLLKENIITSDLKFFVDYLLPLAVICEKKFYELMSKNEKVGAHVYELLQLQIWCILPSVCSAAQDVPDHFKSIAKILGNLISGRKQLRIPAMASLRKLITRSLEQQNKNAERELSRFAKNYLPILFTVYTSKPQGSDDGGERLAAFDTIKVYLTIAGEEICSELFDKAVNVMESLETDAFTKESVMDLLKLLIPFQNESRLSLIYNKCLNAIMKGKVKKEEKKAYRLLEVLVAADTLNCKLFMDDKSKDLLSFILKSLKRNDVKYRGARLRCIFHLLQYIPEKNYNAFQEILPEAVICCKDINRRTRAFAFKLLESILELWRVRKALTGKEDGETIKEYLNIILGGLAGSPTLVSATVLALAKLTSTLRSELPDDVVHLLFESVSLLLALPTREIVGSALVYMKVFTTAIPKNQLFSYLPAIVKAVVSMVDDCKNHFRLKTRDILDRLLRKFGYNTIKLLVPNDDVIMHKRLKNLRRIHLKKQDRKPDTEDEDNSIGEFALKAQPKSIEEILASSDDETDEEEEKLKNSGKSFIEEDPDNIIDFLNPTASSKITATKPSVKPKKERDVKMSSDGRLIIMEDTEEKDEKNDSDLEDIESMLSEVVIGKKRKLSISSEGTSKYEAGGAGIHRPVKNPRLEVAKKLKRKSNKDKLPDLKTGKEYRAKKARGDVKLKGRLDPYAYIPLSRKLMNKRKRQKNSAQFKGVVQAALKGAKKGYKSKKRKQKLD